MLLYVSILRSSSGSLHCSLLKLYVKMLITLLYLLVMRQHIMYICCIPCREVGRPLPTFSVKILDYYNITVHSLVCNKLNKLFLFMWTGPVMYVITFRVSTVSNMSWAISAGVCSSTESYGNWFVYVLHMGCELYYFLNMALQEGGLNCCLIFCALFII
jgi:hypothetical protein